MKIIFDLFNNPPHLPSVMHKKYLNAIFLLAIGVCTQAQPDRQGMDARPNVIFILSDDLSWGDLGCFGQEKIKTPHIDKLAREGMLFTQAYAGSAVCAPSRSCLMQGKHPGHARVRGNSYQSYRESLQPEDYTVAMLFKEAGYRTGLFGKWGLANHDQPGTPNKKGFDEFSGYLNQRHAHCYYPEFLYHNDQREYFPENGKHHLHKNYSQKSTYNQQGRVLPNGIPDPSQAKNAFEVYTEKSLDFLRENADIPFFMYLAYTLPHGPLMVPSLDIYRDKEWPIHFKEWAAMVTYVDQAVGKLMDLLTELNLEQNTLIIFASDNGDSSFGYEGRYASDPPHPTISQFFDSASPTRGRKGGTYDGAFHVPALAWWPEKIAPGQVSDHLWAFWDFMPTMVEMLDTESPSDMDGISFLPTLLGTGAQPVHEYLYWEFKQTQCIRSGDWFARRAPGFDIELYDLIADPDQTKDISASHPALIHKFSRFMNESHTPSDVWPSPNETMEQFTIRLSENLITERPKNIANF